MTNALTQGRRFTPPFAGARNELLAGRFQERNDPGPILG
jgi:hypothetical protein